MEGVAGTIFCIYTQHMWKWLHRRSCRTVKGFYIFFFPPFVADFLPHLTIWGFSTIGMFFKLYFLFGKKKKGGPPTTKKKGTVDMQCGGSTTSSTCYIPQQKRERCFTYKYKADPIRPARSTLPPLAALFFLSSSVFKLRPPKKNVHCPAQGAACIP